MYVCTYVCMHICMYVCMYYMAELAIQSVRKMAYCDWLPDRQILAGKILTDSKTNKPNSGKF